MLKVNNAKAAKAAEIKILEYFGESGVDLGRKIINTISFIHLIRSLQLSEKLDLTKIPGVQKKTNSDSEIRAFRRLAKSLVLRFKPRLVYVPDDIRYLSAARKTSRQTVETHWSFLKANEQGVLVISAASEEMGSRATKF